jgi:hypothetical protein
MPGLYRVGKDGIARKCKPPKMRKKDSAKALREFAKKLLASQTDLDPEYAKILKDHFWDLV